MRKITYDAVNGTPVADGKAEKFALELAQNETDFVVATDNLITATRALIYEGSISHESVCFVFQDRIIPTDKNGRISHWPNGFCDYLDNWLMRLLGPFISKEDVVP